MNGEVTSMYKSMIKRKGSMCEKINSQSLPLKGSKCNLDRSMSKQLKFSIWR